MYHFIEQGRVDYDAFLSHATEDKEAVARPLAKALTVRGLRIWYDEFELRTGASLADKISEGIQASRFGILILSPSFFAKRWTMHELRILENLAVSDNRCLFPIWHNITADELRIYRVSLVDIIAIETRTHTVDEIADELCATINSLRQ